MPNLALKRPIEEDYPGAEVVTDGSTQGYTAGGGFCEFQWPGYMTLDLGERKALKYIRFLLWDGLGTGKGIRDKRQYLYRILLSDDHTTWRVIHDSQSKGYNGWQVLILPNGVLARYLRIHGLWNSANASFHIVELQAYDDTPPDPTEEVVFRKTIHEADACVEYGDGLSIEQNFRTLVNKLESVVREHSDIIKPEPIRELIKQLEIPVRDMTGIERAVVAVRRQIIEPVKRELEDMSRVGKLSFIVGIIGGILAIVSILLNCIL